MNRRPPHMHPGSATRRQATAAACLVLAASLGCHQVREPAAATNPLAASPSPETQQETHAPLQATPSLARGYAQGQSTPACSCCAGATPIGHGGGHPVAARGQEWITGGHAWAPPGLAPYAVNPQEYLCDGGDHAPPAQLRTDDSFAGLALEDTVVKYETRQGETYIEPSNQVCVYAPRFAAVRKLTGAIENEKAVSVGGLNRPEGAVPAEALVPSLALADVDGPLPSENIRSLDAFRDAVGGMPIARDQQPYQAAEVQTPMADLAILEQAVLEEGLGPRLARAALAAETWMIETGVEVMIEDLRAAEYTVERVAEGVHTYELAGKGRVRICKLADRAAAQPGDIVRFVLRVDNVGDGPVQDVVVVDNLTTRLEYVDGSQMASKGAVFSAETNEGESLRLRWEFTDQFEVGETAIIRFQCKVR